MRQHYLLALGILHSDPTLIKKLAPKPVSFGSKFKLVSTYRREEAAQLAEKLPVLKAAALVQDEHPRCATTHHAGRGSLKPP